MKKCLYCYQSLDDETKDFHDSCAKKFFKTKDVPELPYAQEQIGSLAQQVVRSQTTLTGVQPKLSLDVQKLSATKKRFTIVGLWGRYILKPQTEQFRSLPELEDLVMHLAETSKIKVVPHTLIRFSDKTIAYLTERIDRTTEGEKIPMEDFCQLSERMTEQKYKGSYEQIAKLMMLYTQGSMLDCVNFWEVVVFSWIVGNADMHLKNFSLYSVNDNRYQMTPAYDLLSTTVVMPSDAEELALTLNGKKKKLNRHDFEQAMTATGLNGQMINNIFGKMEKSLPKWEEWIAKSFLPSDMQNDLLTLIHKRIASLHEPH